MRKILIGLSAGTAMLLGTVSAFADDGLGFGISLVGGKLSTSGSEIETGSQTAETNTKSVQSGFMIGSVFAEYTRGWFTVGIDYIPVDADVSDATHTRNEQETSVTGTNTETTTARNQSAAATVNDHTTAYIEVGGAVYAKAGYVQMTVETNESLGTGSTYGNVDVNGTVLGVGIRTPWGNRGFLKLEGTYTDYDDISIVSGVARTGVTTNNKITADMDSTQARLAIGYKF